MHDAKPLVNGKIERHRVVHEPFSVVPRTAPVVHSARPFRGIGMWTTGPAVDGSGGNRESLGTTL